MNYSFHPAAEAEFLELVGYYESSVPGLGSAFIEDFEALANLVGESPRAWQVELPPDIRRVPLHRFPLSIVYREKPGGFQVLANASDIAKLIKNSSGTLAQAELSAKLLIS
ncbi:type II toxin-antitoxin system RelE/ParE family toxin [Nitrincola sp. MINF-07-Sa-05]|uniref:type II toxin-antitoxin system RelE/ParE family toxin n=1 Tax=Nitrincola salilacus TaxID=3400273 RepID=UPI00391856F2